VSTQLEAIVLKSFDYQDHHKIVKMISPSHGLISVFMSYANKKKSRYRALAEPLTCVMINVKVPSEERGGLYYLVHGDIVDSYYELKLDYEKIMMFFEMAELIIRGDIDEYHLPYAYRTLKAVLEVDATDDLKFRFGVVVFKAKMTVVVGLLPAIDGCVGCSATSKIITASVTAGGLVCQACYAGDGIWISADLIPLWRALFKLPIERLVTLDVDNSHVCVLETWIKSYYEGYSNIRFANRPQI
jgi:DNA repair protein RecO (recombination protein O)